MAFTDSSSPRTATVTAVRGNLVTIQTPQRLVKNEVAFVLLGEHRIKAEVLRIRGDHADLQVFEDTRGIRTGDRVELSGELLSAQLGPGLLGQIYDGLQNPLRDLARTHGFFLPRGAQADPLDVHRTWTFAPRAETGSWLAPGDVLGQVEEGHLTHAIVVPLAERTRLRLTWLHDGTAGIDDPVAHFERADGTTGSVTMRNRWPVRLPFGADRPGFASRSYPDQPLITGMRIVDTFFPVALGGTACIPGPFGAGKTVLQGLIARYAEVDVVIIIACGERAGEVVETINEFPQMEDPRTGRSLMDRTIIVCNTSAMPIAARESSIYLGLTLGEYYRHMGHRVLAIADSTSRWAQALRETSGRMEEIPGEEAYPAYLDSAIKSVYERAGVIERRDGTPGSLTLIGTVSPAGGNFEEPVTQATLGTVKTFLGLSADRAYRRFYPAIDPLISWSRYVDQLAPALEGRFGHGWPGRVRRLMELLRAGDRLAQLIQVAGEESVTIEDYVAWQKALLLDLAYLQQDAFDEVDRATPMRRQRETIELLESVLTRDYGFASRDAARSFFAQLTVLFRNLNYSPEGSSQQRTYRERILQAMAAIPEGELKTGTPA